MAGRLALGLPDYIHCLVPLCIYIYISMYMYIYQGSALGDFLSWGLAQRKGPVHLRKTHAIEKGS